MNSEKPKSLDAMNVDPSDTGDLTPEIDPDTAANTTDDNVDTAIPEASGGDSKKKVFDSQREMIRRLGG